MLLEIAFLAATGAQAFGQYKGAKDAQKASLFNIGLAEQQLGMIESAKQLDKYRYGKAKEKLLGSQRAGYAKAGVTSEGTPLEVMAESAFNLELDRMVNAYNYDIQKMQVGSRIYDERAKAKAYGRQAIISPLFTLASGGLELKMAGKPKS